MHFRIFSARTFNSSSLVDVKKLPEMVEVYWGANGEQFIGDMCCRAYSEKAESELSDEIEEIADNETEAVEGSKEPEQDNVVSISEKDVNQDEDKVEQTSWNKYIIIGAIALVLIISIFFIFYIY